MQLGFTNRAFYPTYTLPVPNTKVPHLLHAQMHPSSWPEVLHKIRMPHLAFLRFPT